MPVASLDPSDQGDAPSASPQVSLLRVPQGAQIMPMIHSSEMKKSWASHLECSISVDILRKEFAVLESWVRIAGLSGWFPPEMQELILRPLELGREKETQFTRIAAAAADNNLPLLEMIITLSDLSLKGVQIYSRSEPALIWAVIHNNQDMLVLLIQRGASTDERGEYAKTALHHAVELGHIECTRTLLQAGADTEAEDINGRSPMAIDVQGSDNIAICTIFVIGKNFERFLGYDLAERCLTLTYKC